MKFVLESDRALDVICLGRAGIDLYANEKNTDFSQVSGFTKYVGGSAANIAVAASRLGLTTGFVGAVSDDMVGHYVKDYLQQQNIDIRGIQLSPEGTRTSLALTEMKAEDCGVVLYRNDAADLTLSKNKISKDYIASAKILVVTGTSLSTPEAAEATFFAMNQALEYNTKIVLDLDYRPYSWSSLSHAANTLQQAVALSHVLVGNREEYEVLTSTLNVEANADSNDYDHQIADYFLNDHTHIVVVKAGSEGSNTYTNSGECIQQGIFPVVATKPFGSGDAFLGAFVYGLVNQLPLQTSLTLGSASAAINVSSDNCSEAMPTLSALKAWISHSTRGDCNG